MRACHANRHKHSHIIAPLTPPLNAAASRRDDAADADGALHAATLLLIAAMVDVGIRQHMVALPIMMMTAFRVSGVDGEAKSSRRGPLNAFRVGEAVSFAWSRLLMPRHEMRCRARSIVSSVLRLYDVLSAPFLRYPFFLALYVPIDSPRPRILMLFTKGFSPRERA